MAETAAVRPAGAWRSRRAWIVLLAVTAIGLVADLGSKHLAFARIAERPVHVDRDEVLATMADDPRRLQLVLPPHEPVTVVPSVLELKLVLNAGAVFGSGQGRRWFFVGFTVVAIGFAIVLFGRWTRPGDWLGHAAIGLIVSGGLGNLYDRLVFACVRDFLHPLPGVTWPFGMELLGRREIWPYVSNVADAALLVGIAILMVKLWREDGRAKAARRAEHTT